VFCPNPDAVLETTELIASALGVNPSQAYSSALRQRNLAEQLRTIKETGGSHDSLLEGREFEPAVSSD
jgi:hypothetical protein